jgi:hypothetical protein
VLPRPGTPFQIKREGAGVGGSGALGPIPAEPELVQVRVGLGHQLEIIVKDRPIGGARREPDRERLHLHSWDMKNEPYPAWSVSCTSPQQSRLWTCSALLHATVHDRQRTPKKCEDYCERDLVEVAWQGGRVYLHLGAPRDHQARR